MPESRRVKKFVLIDSELKVRSGKRLRLAEMTKDQAPMTKESASQCFLHLWSLGLGLWAFAPPILAFLQFRLPC